jgi:hypothetical protein
MQHFSYIITINPIFKLASILFLSFKEDNVIMEQHINSLTIQYENGMINEVTRKVGINNGFKYSFN